MALYKVQEESSVYLRDTGTPANTSVPKVSNPPVMMSFLKNSLRDSMQVHLEISGQRARSRAQSAGQIAHGSELIIDSSGDYEINEH